MRKPQHLSPTSLALFFANQQEYYLMYLAGERPRKFPQTQPMAAGSAFDAHAKSYLHGRLFGNGSDPKFQLDALYEAQVESQNRDWARPVGEYLFDVYKRSGALADLMLDLQKAIGKPRFELEVKGVINGYREGVTRSTLDVPLLGKPDIFYINRMGAHVIFDWKVNGYCSTRTTSPMQGYVRLREGGQNKGQHKSCQLMSVSGVMINIGQFLEELNEDWARQLTIYSWLCVSGETWTLTSDGPRQVKDCLNKPVTLIVNGHRYATEGFFRTKTAEVFRVSTKEGYFLDATAEHPVMVDYDGQRFWQPVSKLKSRDKVVINNHKNLSWEGEGSYEDGYIVGWTIGDGFFSSVDKQHAMYFYPDDKHLLNSVTDMFQGHQYSLTYLENKDAFRLRSSHLEQLREQFGLGPAKIITPKIEGASSEFYTGFLQAMFDSDGDAPERESRVRLSQSDRGRLEAIQRMLLRFGIASTIYLARSEMIEGRLVTTKPKWSLEVGCGNTITFQNRVGFTHKQKRDRLQRATEARNRTFKEDYLVEVLEVQSIGLQQVYDVSVPGINAFDANGFFVHNCGEDIGAQFIVAIDQMVCKPIDGMPRPFLRVAEHRLRVRPEFQWRVFSQAQQAWEIINSNHFFRDMSFEESRDRCMVLDGVADALKGDGSDADEWFAKVTRGI